MTNHKQAFVIEEEGQRLDKFLTDALSAFSRTEIQSLIKSGNVLVDEKARKASYRLGIGETVTIILPEPEDEEITAEKIDLAVVYEDDDIIVVNKKAGMVVHPAYGNRTGTLVNAALYRWQDIRGVGGDEERSGVVHRLDKDTSGLILLAKTDAALSMLQAQFKERTVYKRYIALVEGSPSSDTGVIEAAIGRDPRKRKRMAVLRDGREAITKYELLEDLMTHSLLSLEPKTGRTHQIRVHMAWLGNPVVGDMLYGYRKQRIKMKRLFLHAADLHIDLPSTHERLRLEASLPVECENVLAKLRQNMRAKWE